MSYASLYTFCARAFHSPPDEAFLELAADIPGLKAFLGQDLNDQFTWLFEFNVYPFAAVFLDPSGMLNSDWAGFVSGIYKALELEVNVRSSLAADDHLAVQLEALSVLCEREEGADNDLLRERARHGQKVLLVEQVLPWLPIFVNAIKRIDKGFYRHIAELTLELCLEHASALLQDTRADRFVFPNDEDELQDIQFVDVKKKAGEARSKLQGLITAARSGLFLSRDDITRLGRTLDLPVRFAERPFMLENLITSASDSGQLNDLFHNWQLLSLKEQASIQTLQTSHANLAPLWGEWLDKMQATYTYLEDLKI